VGHARSRQRTLTQQSYAQIGGIAGALASHADAVLAELAPQSQPLARAVLLRLITPERTRAIVSLDELGELSHKPGEIMRLVEHLVHARLLVVQAGPAEQGKTVELVHESLIHTWPLLRRWLDENQDDAVFLEQLRSAARQWERRGRPGGLLWRGEAMDEARTWHRRYRGELPAVQREYLQAVFAQGARAARARRIIVAGVIAFLSLLVASAAVALFVIRDAQNEATEQARQVKEQLVRVQAEQDRREQAEVVAKQASDEVDTTRDALARRNAELEQALARAQEARQAAEQAERRADQARQRAEANEGAARAAESRALDANERLKVLLAREKARADRLAEQGTQLVDEVP
jgi:eukaryotic-like serine/threonine-protein kinase